jgi:hypothetical protein
MDLSAWVVWHEPGRCCRCGTGLSGAPVTRTGRRQVTGLPEDIPRQGHPSTG